MEQSNDRNQSLEEKFAARTAKFVKERESTRRAIARNRRLDRLKPAPMSILYECPGCGRLSRREHLSVCGDLVKPIDPTKEEKLWAKNGPDLPEYDFYWYGDQGLEDPY